MIVVGQNAANPGGSKNDVIRTLGCEKVADGCLVAQVELGMGAQKKLGITFRLEASHAGAADHATGTGYVDFGSGKHFFNTARHKKTRKFRGRRGRPAS